MKMQTESDGLKYANDRRLEAVADPTRVAASVFEFPTAKNGRWPLVQTAVISDFNPIDGTWNVAYIASDGYPLIQYRKTAPQ